MSVDFRISNWGEETIQLEIVLVDASPDGTDVNVYCARIHGEEIYFESPVGASVQGILQDAVTALKDFLEMDNP